jgi:phosphopantothenoylcysteine decarboxylase/phosphopantothenate--cysteine ligase
MIPRGREIILGVSASISAYKSADLLRRLQDEGFLVTVVPTKSSLNFVGVATWEALSKRKVRTDLWQDVAEAAHTDLARDIAAIVIAPSTADLLAKIAAGICDDLLTNVIMVSEAPKILVPSMHPQMWLNPATIANVETLRNRGFVVIEPEFGRMTGTDVGIGRFPESATIISQLNSTLNHKADLKGKKILISAGGTVEPIDPVRFIGNRSSGKQGFALAYAAALRGAEVHLVVAGEVPELEKKKLEGVTISAISTADEMAAVMRTEAPFSDAIFMSAAVADAKPAKSMSRKIKKEDLQRIDLNRNEDILQTLSDLRREKVDSTQQIIGFAAETLDGADIATAAKNPELINSGRKKLNQKGVDFIYVNDVTGGKIFGSDQTSGVLVCNNGETFEIDEISKLELSNLLLDKVSARFK